MGINIKNPETERLARELAQQTGESLTLAIKVAIQERLHRQQSNSKAGLAAWLDEFTRRIAPLAQGLPPSDKIGDLLYDKETGMPL